MLADSRESSEAINAASSILENNDIEVMTDMQASSIFTLGADIKQNLNKENSREFDQFRKKTQRINQNNNKGGNENITT